MKKYVLIILLFFLQISIVFADSINIDEDCIKTEIPKEVERWKGVCRDWWDPANEYESEDFDNYPSSEICDCFEKKFVEKISEKDKRNLAMLQCKYDGDWGKFYNSKEYKDFLKFGSDLWDLCDKEVPRLNSLFQ